jgi:sugar lactone lactonase YvrE
MKHSSTFARTRLAFSTLGLALGVQFANAQQTAPGDAAPHPFHITRADPALDALIAPDAKLRTVASGFGFIDGPVWVRGRHGAKGFLLASSIIDNVVYKVTAAGKVSVYLDQAGYSGQDFANVGKFAYIGRAHTVLFGPGCTGIDAQGRLIWCAGQDLQIKRLEKDGTRTVLANGFEGKHFNGPNDGCWAARRHQWPTGPDARFGLAMEGRQSHHGGQS